MGRTVFWRKAPIYEKKEKNGIRRIAIPNPHQSNISGPLFHEILRQANLGDTDIDDKNQ